MNAGFAMIPMTDYLEEMKQKAELKRELEILQARYDDVIKRLYEVDSELYELKCKNKRERLETAG